MKLKIISSKISDGSIPKATFSKRAIRLNKIAVEIYGIKSGDKLALSQDTQNPNDWYLIITKKRQDVPTVSINKLGMATVDYPDAVDEIRSHFHINRSTFRLKLRDTVSTEYGLGIQLITEPLGHFPKKEKEVQDVS